MFVHFPKTGGSAVHYTAEKYGRRLRVPPDPTDGHKPASWFGVDKPSWAVLRDPLDWYVSMYRFCVDAEWSVMPEGVTNGTCWTFPEFVSAKAGYYSDYCRSLEIAGVTHLYHYDDVQRAYNTHVGPETLLTVAKSVSPAPVMTRELEAIIRGADWYGYEVYSRVRGA